MANPEWPPPLPPEEPPPLPPEDEAPPLPPPDPPPGSVTPASSAAWPPSQQPPAPAPYPGAPHYAQWANGQGNPAQQYPGYPQPTAAPPPPQQSYPGTQWQDPAQPGYPRQHATQLWQQPPSASGPQGANGAPSESYMQPPPPAYGQWGPYQQQHGYQTGYDAYGGYTAMGAYQPPGHPPAYGGQHPQQAPYGHPAYAPAHNTWVQQAQPGVMGSWSNQAAPPLLSGVSLIPTKNEVTAEELFMKPGRDKRPRKIAVLLRGLPGSGKSLIAKKLRELEVEHGGDPPRIHAIDDYFVTEVEKELEEAEPGKKPKKRAVMVTEYLYEAELEDTYKQSILKAFTKTVEEGRFPFVILDAPNIRVDDFKPFYLAGQRAGYEVYVVKPLDTDPEVCFKRNIHQRDLEAIQDLAALYEGTPKIYTQLLVDGLFDLPKPPPEEEDAPIEEIDMEDDSAAAAAPEEGSQEPKIKSRWSALEEEPQESEPAPRKKRRKKEGDESSSPPAAGVPAPLSSRPTTTSVLRKPGAAPPGKSVRWADEAEPAQGFTMGGPAAQQLEVVFYVAGLGPAMQDESQRLSFQEQAKAERKTEGRSFRDVLFGGRLA